jgi:cytidylate kinase
MVASDVHSLAAARIDQYLLEQRGRQPAQEGAPSSKARPVITISRTLGVPAGEIAALVAKELGFMCLDREVLDTVSHETRLAERIVSALDAGSLSALDSWFASLVDYDHRVVDRHSYHFIVSRVIRGISYHGSAVLVGRGANFILRGTSAFCVRLTAPTALRAQALLAGSGPERCATIAEAKRRLHDHAALRKHFISSYFRADIDDPEAYDAIFSLRRLDPGYGAQLIVDSYRRAVGE